jgi:hypothetical protein
MLSRTPFPDIPTPPHNDHLVPPFNMDVVDFHGLSASVATADQAPQDLQKHLHELWLSFHLRAILETPVRGRLPARQTLSGLAALLDDMGRRSVGHVGGHDIEKSQVVYQEKTCEKFIPQKTQKTQHVTTRILKQYPTAF